MTNMDSNARKILTAMHHGVIAGRRLPQEVAGNIVGLGLDANLDEDSRRTLQRLAEHATLYGRGYSMPTTFRRHPGLERAFRSSELAMLTVAKAAGIDMPATPDAQDPVSLAVWVDWANEVLGLKQPAALNPVKRGPRARIKSEDWGGGYTYTYRNGSRGRRGDSHGHAHPAARMTAAERRENLPGVAVRAYRRAIRTVNHLEQRNGVLAAERDREAAVAFGKTRLASTIELDAFVDDPATAAFVAYYVARLGARTVFTNVAQDRPMDEVAEALLTAAMNGENFRADVVAAVLTRRSVLARLTEEQKGALLGAYYEQLAACSRALARSFDPKRNRTEMVARPGDDSSTWNAASRAFNQARTGWLNLLGDLGMDYVVDEMCPGKVPALVAADVAYWHRASGSEAHKDVAVFAELPLPWEVILGGHSCSSEDVRAACARHGIDADAAGWTKAYRQAGLEVAAPTPDLVHGVVVASPALAYLLRKSNLLAGGLAGRVTLTSPEADARVAAEEM